MFGMLTLTEWLCPQAISLSSTSVKGIIRLSLSRSMKTFTLRGCNSHLNDNLLLVTKNLPSVLCPVIRYQGMLLVHQNTKILQI